MGIEGIMARSFAQFGVVRTDYDMRRLLTENALLRQPGGIQEAAQISPDVLTPEGRESYAQIALLVRQAARRLQEERERELRQESAERARAEREEELLSELRQEQQDDARTPQDAPAAMTRDETAREAAAPPDSAAAAPTGGEAGTQAADAERPAHAERASPLPADRTGKERQSLSASLTPGRPAGQTPDPATNPATNWGAGLTTEPQNAPADGPPETEGRTEAPSPLHLTV